MQRPQETNPSMLPFPFEQELEFCNLKPDETAILVTDMGTRREYVEAAFAKLIR